MMVMRVNIGTIDLIRKIGTDGATDSEHHQKTSGWRDQQKRGRSICTGAWMGSFPMSQELETSESSWIEKRIAER